MVTDLFDSRIFYENWRMADNLAIGKHYYYRSEQCVDERLTNPLNLVRNSSVIEIRNDFIFMLMFLELVLDYISNPVLSTTELPQMFARLSSFFGTTYFYRQIISFFFHIFVAIDINSIESEAKKM